MAPICNDGNAPDSRHSNAEYKHVGPMAMDRLGNRPSGHVHPYAGWHFWTDIRLDNAVGRSSTYFDPVGIWDRRFISVGCCACAGTTVISRVDGYAAAPPGTQTPTRRSG